MKDAKGGTLQFPEDALPVIEPVVQEGGELIELAPAYFLVEESRLDEGSEDGFSLSRRSVLTEKLLPARWTPVPRGERARHGRMKLGSLESLPV